MANSSTDPSRSGGGGGEGGLVVPFRPKWCQTPANNQQQQHNPPAQPQFVVFELFRQQQQSPVAAGNQPPTFAGTPFLPLGSPQNVAEQQQQKEDKPQMPAGVRFSTVQLEPDHPALNMNKGKNGLSTPGGRSRLLFDNPLFRRLPNWHFFGDDRRLARIPALMIPLIPVPVERTLLYIAPSVSSARQLMLCTLADLQQRKRRLGAIEFGNPPMIRSQGDNEEATTNSSSSSSRPTSSEPEEEEEDEDGVGLELLPSSTTSSSGVESMSSEETATTARSSPAAMTPVEEEEDEEGGQWMNQLRTPTPPMDDEGESAPARSSSPQTTTTAEDSVPSSSAANSPLTYERRTVRRMSRGTRDAVRRLSRRFCEDDEEEEEVMNPINAVPLANTGPAPAANPVVTMMSTAGETPPLPVSQQFHHRNRQGSVSSNSNCSSSTTATNKKRPQPSSISDDAIIERMDELSQRILNFHQNEEQTQFQLNRKLQLRDQLYYAISPIFPMCGLYIVGSSLNGFGTSRSDLDLCLMITNRDIDQRSDAVVVLSSVMRTLESNKMVAEQKLILAKVPILRIKFIGTFSDILVDLNVNNSVAIRNTHLMCYYSNFDWRVRALVNIVKEWAKRHNINNASCSSFTSYSLVLMVIHYLQCGAKPPVLPNLQNMYSRRFSSTVDVRTLNVSLPLEPLPHVLGWKFKMEMSLSDLLLGFLKYYAYQFDFDVDAISIRIGQKVNRAQVAQNQSPFNTLSQWHCICIEEPFTLSNAAHSVYDERIFQDIKKAFVDSYHELNQHRDLERFLGPPVRPKSSCSSSTVDSVYVEEGEQVVISITSPRGAQQQQQNGAATTASDTVTADAERVDSSTAEATD